MLDANGTRLQLGDRVLIPGIIKTLTTERGYCNVVVETALGRRPDGEKCSFPDLNTAQIIKVMPTAR